MAATLDPSKCTVGIEAPCPIFASSEITLKLKLFDLMSNPVDKLLFNQNLLIVKISGLFCAEWQPITAREERVNNVLYLKVPRLGCEKDCKVCRIKLEYGDKQLGRELSLDITHVIPFNEKDYIVKDVSYPYFSLKIIRIPIYKLKGDDGAVIKNINRILNSEHRLFFRNFQIDQCSSSPYADIDVDISVFEGDCEECEQIYSLLTLYIKGVHYRNEAAKFNKKRQEPKAKAVRGSETENFKESIKEQYSKLMEEADLQASEALFEFFNRNRPSNQIDLHGQLVADDEKLEEYRVQLLKKHSEVEANEKVIDARGKMNEALRHLRKAQVESQRGRDWLEIIVGAGQHSKDNRQKIRPKVEKYLKDHGIHEQYELKECNKGSILIRYKKYTGKEPCFGSFYCKKPECGKSWYSSLCWEGYWQLCLACYKKDVRSECYPMKLSSHSGHSRKPPNYGSSFTPEDHRKLCQKCLVTGTYCKYLRNKEILK